MSNPTTPFSWQMPTSTDLVTDLPADFEVFGQAVATSMADLLGGTTGQYLVKNSATDMDFIWTTNSGDVSGVTAGTGITVTDPTGPVPTVTNSMATAIDAKGDLVVGTGADAFSKLTVGANNTVLIADSAQATGLKWGTPSAASNFSLIGTGTLTGAATITVSGLSNLNVIYVAINEASSASAASSIQLRLNADSGANYDYYYYDLTAASTYSVASIFDANSSTGQNQVFLGKMSGSASSRVVGFCRIEGGATAGQKMMTFATGASPSSSDSSKYTNGMALWNNSSTITSVSLISTIGNFDGGTFLVYGG